MGIDCDELVPTGLVVVVVVAGVTVDDSIFMVDNIWLVVLIVATLELVEEPCEVDDWLGVVCDGVDALDDGVAGFREVGSVDAISAVEVTGVPLAMLAEDVGVDWAKVIVLMRMLPLLVAILVLDGLLLLD